MRPDGSGGDEWSRVYRNKKTGMPSPIQQARRQSEFLRAFLERHRKELVGRMPMGLRTIANVVSGTDQRGFMRAPMQLVIAVSDGGRITRLGGWKEPRKPFRVFVAKADSVPDKIAQELKQHRAGARLLTLNPMEEYGLWNMEAGEAETVAGFLAARHAERSSAPRAHSSQTPVNRSRDHSKPDPARPESFGDVVCKHCGATDLTARWGKFGYYWRCRACGKNTKSSRGVLGLRCPATAGQPDRENTEGRNKVLSRMRGVRDLRIGLDRGLDLDRIQPRGGIHSAESVTNTASRKPGISMMPFAVVVAKAPPPMLRGRPLRGSFRPRNGP